MTVSAFVNKYKLAPTGKKHFRYYCWSKRASYQVIFYPNGDIAGEIYRSNGTTNFTPLSAD